MEIIDKVKPEEELILCCARTSLDSRTENRVKYLAGMDLDWNHLLKMAILHKVAVLLYLNLSSVCPEFIPVSVLLELKRIFYKNTQRNLLVSRELIKILAIFEENKINTIPYKGITLSILAYGNLKFRQFNDIDIFIEKEDFRKVKNALISHNYLIQYPLNHNKEDLHLKHMHELKFINTKNNIPVEIQWKFSGICSHLQKDINKHIKELKLKSISINNYNILTFNPEDLFIILCLHAAGHSWSRLLWICDLNEMINSNVLDWKRIVDIAHEWGIERILFISLILTNDLLDTRIPNELLFKIKSDGNVKDISTKIKRRMFINPLIGDFIFCKIIFHKKIRENPYLGLKMVYHTYLILLPMNGKLFLYLSIYPLFII
ncbi:nucleotidyltransferase domain-containing protein [Methanobacterium ferruginis]|uniref:nucleotidyltransferase domain-containing protein n=1 Tax=Methanobacterium ferruginis TaxID=710191 RepID=UPI00257347E0|nr:nucleotidyltransferase family protein [Methanobacterium ferruginis]BDZ69009.1 hypothetical protein GCM10025860_24570 [Methanobacterium ferruginis]